MAAQYDFLAGFDLSSVSTVTQAQLIQALNQMAPLSNIGLVIWSSTAPVVADNARFARYIWIDTSASPYTLKTWDGAAWTAATIGANAINAITQITNKLITIGKFSTSGGSSGALIRVSPSDTTSFEFVTLATLLAGVNSVPIAGLFTTGEVTFNSGVAQFLFHAKDSNTPIWKAFDPSDTTIIGLNSVELSRLVNGTANQFIKADGAGAWAARTLVAGDIPDNILTPSNMRLSDATAAYQVLRKNSTNAAYEWGMAAKTYSEDIAIPGADGLITTAAHNLGGHPDVIKVNLICQQDTNTGSNPVAHSYAAGDVIDAMTLRNALASQMKPCIETVYSPTAATTIKFYWLRSESITMFKNDGSVLVITDAQMGSNFKFRVKAVRFNV